MGIIFRYFSIHKTRKPLFYEGFRVLFFYNDIKFAEYLLYFIAHLSTKMSDEMRDEIKKADFESAFFN